MASTRSSSPASRGGTPELLTPRSKIKALLATVDSSDDDDASTTAAGLARSRRQLRELGLLGNSLRPGEAQSDSSDGSDIEVKPRGRLAARLQAGAAATTLPRIQPPEKDASTQVSESAAAPDPDSTRDALATGASSGDDDLPVAPRRLKRRMERPTTPTRTAESPNSNSPGLFVSSPLRPSPSKEYNSDDESGSDPELPSLKSDRFKALVERKRQERMAREAEEEARRAQRQQVASELAALEDDDDENVSNITDDEGGRRLTQEARPTRKASKRAIEEMNRETQRIARSMQLRHEAKTRNKITTASLFERFNYTPANYQPAEAKMTSSSRPTTPHSDVDMDNNADTPPSSPPLEHDKPQPVALQLPAEADLRETQVPQEVTDDTAPTALNKGKGKAVDLPEQADAAKPKRRQFRVKLPPTAFTAKGGVSDDELQVVTTTKDKMNAVFNSIPCHKDQESHSLQALRALAHLKSPGPGPRGGKVVKGISGVELQERLRRSVREQAKLERHRRLEMLKASGVVVQTTEERERQMQEVEDMLNKAREEAHEIMQKEREAAKQARKESGEADPLDWDESEDEDYTASGDEADVDAVELSGSEEEDGGEDAEDETSNKMVDDLAEDADSESSESEEEDAENKVDENEVTLSTPALKTRRPRKQNVLLSDDEDEVDVQATPMPKSKTQTTPNLTKTTSPAAPGSVLRSAKKSFIPGFPVQGPAGLGLTQIFAGTMDDSQAGTASGPTQSMMPDFDEFPDSNFSATAGETLDQDVIMDSQAAATEETQQLQFTLAQTQLRGAESLMHDNVISQMTDIEPSQDIGFQTQTPLRERFVEPPVSTVETIPAEQAGGESPLVQRKRLRRRAEAVESETLVPQSPEKPTAFAAIKAGAEKEHKKKVVDDFDRKKSKAKEMIEEQAEESEDEYAGLGGHDGEDSDNESMASVNEMIDDAASNSIDERKLAAFYADRERAQDEKDVEKLFKDITSGMLRRKRGADYDLSDSDDGGEARRRMKRRQFAKAQKALFSDERVKKMAENPGNQAFLRTIEDRNSDDEMDFLDITEMPAEAESQPQSQPDGAAQAQVIPDSQPRNPLGTAGENRAPASARRTTHGKRPSNIGEVRETLSNLLDEPLDAIIPATGDASASEGEESSPRSDKENQQPNPRRGRAAVVDRISLKRNSSSSLSSASGRLAFTAGAGPSSSSFKVPALLRRATTNSLASSAGTTTTTSATGVSTSTGGGAASSGAGGAFGEDAKIKKATSRKTGINAFARETERRARMQESERRREEKKVRGAERRMGVVGGLLGRGSFE